MVKLTYYVWQSITHCATLEGMGRDSTTGETVTYYRAWYDADAQGATPDDAAVILADHIGQGIARIYTEEQPED